MLMCEVNILPVLATVAKTTLLFGEFQLFVALLERTIWFGSYRTGHKLPLEGKVLQTYF